MSARESGYLIVKKIDNASRILGSGRKNVLGLSRVDVETRYIGLECEPWPDESAPPPLGDFPGLAPESYRGLLQHKYENAWAHENGLRFLYVAPCRTNGPKTVKAPPGFAFCGYDYGWLNSRSSNYSVLYNEVVYGLYGRLTSFAKHLNEHLLMASLDPISFLIKARNELLQEKADLETAEDCYPVQIYQFAINKENERQATSESKSNIFQSFTHNEVT